MFTCWTEGAAGLRRMPHTQTSGAARIYSTHLHEGSIRQDSFSLQSGSYPTASLESLPALRFRFGSVRLPVPSEQSNAPATPSVQHNIHS